jgi:hypothetical protein
VRLARDAQRRPRALDPRPLADAAKWASGLKATWDARFSRLDDVLVAMKKERKTRRDPHPRSERQATRRRTTSRS